MTSSVSLRRLRAASLAAFAVVSACSSDKATAPPTAANVVAVGDVSVAGVAGEMASAPLIVRVTDSNGNAVANIPVTFSVVDGGGTIAPAVDTTDSGGRAETVWRFGGTAGAQRAQAQVSGVTGTVTYIATVAAATPATVAVQAGDNQSGVAGQVLATQPSVIIKDRFNNPVPGVSVFFTVASGGGSLTSNGATTNSAGVATATGFRLGSAAGVNKLTALALVNGAAGNPVTFTATGTSGAATSLVANNATTISANAGALVVPSPSVRVVDAAGNPVAGATVTFAGSAGSTVVGGTKTTDSNGLASVDGFQLGTLAGTYTLTASSGTLTPVIFSATARATNAATVSIFAGNNQSAISGRPVDIEPAVRVLDAFGNPVAGADVVFDVITGGGFAVGRRVTTGANGVGTVGGWTLGETPGPNSLRATVTATGLTNGVVTFNATGTAGAPAASSVQAGNNQTATAGQAVSTPPSVLVRDSRGNPVAGVPVTFIVTAGGGTVIGGNAVTNAQGVATVTSYTLGNVAGPQTLIARVAGLPDVTFTSTATAGQAANIIPLSLQALGSVPVNTLITPAPQVRVVDAQGNAVANANVEFTVDAGGSAVLTGASTVTSATGFATLASLRAGTVAGVVTTIRATVPGLNLGAGTPTFVFTTIAGTPAQIAVAPGSAQTQSGMASTAVASPPSVRVTDSFGNVISGVAVEFITTDGTVTGSPATTNALGIATVGSWVLPAGSGARTLSARLVNSPSVAVGFTANVP